MRLDAANGVDVIDRSEQSVGDGDVSLARCAVGCRRRRAFTELEPNTGWPGRSMSKACKAGRGGVSGAGRDQRLGGGEHDPGV